MYFLLLWGYNASIQHMTVSATAYRYLFEGWALLRYTGAMTPQSDGVRAFLSEGQPLQEYTAPHGCSRACPFFFASTIDHGLAVGRMSI